MEIGLLKFYASSLRQISLAKFSGFFSSFFAYVCIYFLVEQYIPDTDMTQMLSQDL